MANLLRSASALVVVVSLASPAFAAKADREQPMQVGANQSQTSEKTGITVLSGDVRIDQGSLMIRADRGEFEQKEGEVNRVVLDGAPVHLEQDIDNQGRLKADAKRIEYLLSDQKVVMTGERVVYQPRQRARSKAGGTRQRPRQHDASLPKPKARQGAAAEAPEG
jgi:lipopolysaccharide export system protein LptA